MRVPIRKAGKYTHLKADPHITPAKFKELKLKLDRFKNISRPRAASEVKRLALMGDFSENAAYQIAKGRLRGLNQRILDIEDLLKRAEIIQPDKNSRTVQLGHLVTVETSGRQRTYQILGSTETSPSSGIISHNSPLGSALMSRHIGDTIKVHLNGKTILYKILKIE